MVLSPGHALSFIAAGEGTIESLYAYFFLIAPKVRSPINVSLC